MVNLKSLLLSALVFNFAAAQLTLTQFKNCVANSILLVKQGQAFPCKSSQSTYQCINDPLSTWMAAGKKWSCKYSMTSTVLSMLINCHSAASQGTKMPPSSPLYCSNNKYKCVGAAEGWLLGGIKWKCITLYR
jgi:hypothetical protein